MWGVAVAVGRRENTESSADGFLTFVSVMCGLVLDVRFRYYNTRKGRLRTSRCATHTRGTATFTARSTHDRPNDKRAPAPSGHALFSRALLALYNVLSLRKARRTTASPRRLQACVRVRVRVRVRLGLGLGLGLAAGLCGRQAGSDVGQLALQRPRSSARARARLRRPKASASLGQSTARAGLRPYWRCFRHGAQARGTPTSA